MVLLEALGELRGLVKVKHTADIDGSVFKLHYRVTATILFGCSLLVTCNSLLGKPIHCSHGSSPYLNDDVVNTFCWIHSTFTLPRYLHGKGILPYPGVGQAFKDDEVTHHAYYQWVPFMLFLQGLLFYIPHWLWKTWEGGKIEAIVAGLSTPIMSSADRKERISKLTDYICTSLHSHNFYAFKFFICEILNFVNVFCNMLFLNRFLGGLFMSYGVEVLNFTETDQSQRTDPMIVVFPRVTKCTFQMFGPSGTVVTHDLMCVLALNVINEKIFVFMWFWFVILITLTCLSFLYRLLVLCVPVIRSGLLQKRAHLQNKSILNKLVPSLHFGDYFLLYLISKNVEILSVTTLLEEMAHEVGRRRRSTRDPEVYAMRNLGRPPVAKDQFALLSEKAS